MINPATGKNSRTGDFNLPDNNAFFGFAKPYFNFVGKGKIYNVIYIVMAIINLLIPFAAIYAVIDSGFLQYSGAKFIVAFIFSWLIIAFASWIGFQLWWHRKSIVRKVESAEFIATPVISDLIQTSGEWLGTFIGITGAGIGLITTIFLGNSADQAFRQFGLGFINYAPLLIITGPVTGFFIILISRFLAEQIKIFTSIANNTREIAKNSRK